MPETYNIIGYGSLLSHQSLLETCKNKKFTPIIVKDFKRVFNLKSEVNKKSDILNLKKQKNSLFNAVQFKVNKTELKKLKEREDWYNFEKTKYFDFKTRKLLGEGFISIDYSILIDKKGYKPEKSYFILCREAAYNISNSFGCFWDYTTYTSKNEKISDWINKNTEYNTIK